MLAQLIPIILFLATAAVIITWIFYRSKERQLMIEKGLSAEEIMALFARKKDPYLMMKIGIVIFSFGVGLGLGMLIKDATGQDAWIPFMLIALTGAGFIIAHFVVRRMTEKDSNTD